MKHLIITDATPEAHSGSFFSSLEAVSMKDPHHHTKVLAILEAVFLMPFVLFGVNPAVFREQLEKFMAIRELPNQSSIFERLTALVEQQYGGWAATLNDAFTAELGAIGIHQHRDGLRNLFLRIIDTPQDAITAGMNEVERETLAYLCRSMVDVVVPSLDSGVELAHEVAEHLGVTIDESLIALCGGNVERVQEVLEERRTGASTGDVATGDADAATVIGTGAGTEAAATL